MTRFRRALDKSLDYANAHPDAVRQIVGTYAKIPTAALNDMVLPYWSHDLNKPSIDKVAGLMVKYGVVSSKPDLSNLYAT